MSNAIVTDARLIMALPIIRSLGRAGIKVVAMESESRRRGFIPGFYSRYTSKRVLHTDLLQSLLIQSEQADAVFPVSGEAVYTLARAVSDGTLLGSPFSSKVALPKLESIETGNDKMRLNELARSLGVPVPETYRPEVQVDLGAPSPKVRRELRSWSRDLHFPVIVKYRYGEGLNLPADQRYRFVQNPDEFAEAYMEIHERQPFPLVQEYIPGEDYGAAILCDRDAEVVASFTYRSIRQRPKVGGPTTCAQSVSYPAMVAHLKRIARALSWYGVAMGDFRRTPDGQFRLLEINPRFWGSLALAVEAGVDFPLLYYELVLNEGYLKKPAAIQRNGVWLRFFFQDALAVIEYAKVSPRPWLYAVAQAPGAAL